MSDINITLNNIPLMERTPLEQTPNDTTANKLKNMGSSTRNIVIEPTEIYNWIGFSSLNDLYKHMERSVGYDK